MSFTKSILRSLIDGGTDLSNETLLIDRLEEFSQSTETNKTIALCGGAAQIVLGLATATMNPVGLVSVVLGAYSLTRMKPNTLSNNDERELRLLSKHRNVFGVLKRLKQRGVNQEEILQGYEALVSRYNHTSDEIVLTDGHQIPASNAIVGLESMKQLQDQEGAATPVKPKSWLLENMRKRPALPQQLPLSDTPSVIGAQTQFNEIDVPAHREQQQPQQLTVQQVIALPLPDRAQYLMKLLAESGCDLRKLAGRPTLAAGGLQRSGKTTLIVLLAILEKAMGQKIYYITRDNDLYPVAFDGYANGSTPIAVEALTALSDRINTGSMGSLKGETWILDEFSSTAKEMPDKIRDAFWGMALTGFAKQGGRVRFIVHHKTATANGIPPGEAETFKSEVKLFWTDRLETESGIYQPSGQYELFQEVAGYYKASGAKFVIPEWLLSDVNPEWHNAPCPVRSLLQFFPEFDTRKGAKADRLSNRRSNPFPEAGQTPIDPIAQKLNRLLDLPSADHEVDESGAEQQDTTTVELKTAFPDWSDRKVEIAIKALNHLKKNPNGLLSSEVKSKVTELKKVDSIHTKNLLIKLEKHGFIHALNDRYFLSAANEEDDFNW